MKAVVCPVCNGSGMYEHPPETQGVVIVVSNRPCHGCGGKGWYEVPPNTCGGNEYFPITPP